MDDLKAKHMKFLHDKIDEASYRIRQANEFDAHKIPFWHEQINGYRADLMKLMQEEENSNG